MGEYIDKEKLIEILEQEVEEADDWKTAHEIANVVKYFPSADVRENKRGHWTATPTGDYRCSECGYFTVDLVCVKDGEGWVEIAPNYCSRCGAEMKEEKDEKKIRGED